MSFIRSLATVVDNSRRRLHTWADENPEGMAKLALWLEDTSRNETSFADLAGSLLKSWVPLNWWHLQIGKQQRAVSLMTETGICLVWVPPLEILEAILEAACKEERDAVLLANADAILDSIEEVLAEATHPQITTTVAAT